MRLSYRMKPGPLVSRDTASVVDAGFRTDSKGKAGEGFISFSVEDV